MKIKAPRRKKEKADPFAFFKKTAKGAFAFLTADYGFRHVSTSEHLPECALTFWNRTTAVAIAYEWGGAPWVTVGELEHAPDRTYVSKSYGLHVVVEERCPGREAELGWGHAYGRATEQDLETFLRAQATLLRECAAELLTGEFGIFPALKKRTAEHRRRRNKELFGSYSGETPRFASRPALSELFAGAKDEDPELTELLGGRLNQDKTGFKIYQAYWDYEYPIPEIAKFLSVDEEAVRRALDEQDDVG
jgi:hypothetical protein